MSSINEILDKMSHTVENISEVIDKKKAKGIKIIGTFPVYAPEELVYAAGMFPVGCWGGKTSISKASAYLPPFACPVMQGITELSLNGVYDRLDGAIVSTPCDTLKCFSQNILYTNPDIKTIFCVYPQNNKLEAAVLYIKNELKKIATQLEDLSGIKITDERLNDSIEIYNENRKSMIEFSQILSENPGVLAPKMRYIVMKSRFFMDKKEHTILMNELNQLLKNKPKVNNENKKIVLAGIMAEPSELVDVMGQLGYSIVADELANGSRQFRNLVPQGIDQFERLARQWQNVEGCSVVCDKNKKRASIIAELAKNNNADGVIYCQLKFCDPEEFDYPYVKEALENINIPILNLEVDPIMSSAEQSRTRLQAFAEQLESRIS
nr:2-hydroxyacyl-CoA dehydratase family protein [Sedimentibacter sp.]